MKSVFILIIGLFAIAAKPVDNTDVIVGTWQNSTGKGHIQIYKNSGKFFGKISWLQEPLDKKTGLPKVDEKNPDPARRNSPIMGLVMMHDFTYEEGEWRNGKIYLPSEGKEYNAYIRFKDANTLSVRGYVGISLFGKTDVWTRVE